MTTIPASGDANAARGHGASAACEAITRCSTSAPRPATSASGNATPDAPKPESRIVVAGDSDFVANNAIGIQGNQDLFLNAVNWLAQQENLIAIRPRDAQDRRITLTADQQQWIMLLSLLVIPGLVFAAGGFTWWRRR